MADFSASQSFQTLGLCAQLKATDTSDYVNNTQHYTEANIESKKFTFRDSGGNIIKQEIVAANVYQSIVNISLLTFNVSCQLDIKIKGDNTLGYSAYNAFTVPCIGI